MKKPSNIFYMLILHTFFYIKTLKIKIENIFFLLLSIINMSYQIYNINNSVQTIKEDTCFLNNPNYWRAGYRFGGQRSEKIIENELSDNELKNLLSDMHINECLAFYNIFEDNENLKDKWEKIIKFNPYGEDLICHSYTIWFEKKDCLLSSNIIKYPSQLDQFITYLKNLCANTIWQHIRRIEIIRYLTNVNTYDSTEDGLYHSYEDWIKMYPDYGRVIIFNPLIYSKN